VFLARKVPVPFTLTNVVVGATPIRYRDFLVGTTLGMVAVVVALAGFGYQLAALWHHPSPRSIGTAGIFLAVPLTMAYLINRTLRRARSIE
jgi:phospholipase D1/2